MGRDVLTKTYLMTFISSMFISNTLAANADNFLGSWTGFSGAGEGIAGVVNAALWYDINSLPQALIFVAVFGGIYFVTIKIIHMVFHYIIGAINLGTTSRYSARGSDDGPSTAEKGASAAIAFVATQYAGLVLGSAFFIMALFSTLIIMIAFIRLFQAFRTGSSEMSVGSNGDSGGFIDVDLSLGGGDDNPDPDPDGDTSEAEGAEEDAEEHEGNAEDDMDAAESDAESGDTERAGEEAEAAVEEMKAAIKDMDIAAADIEDLMRTEHEQLDRTLNELSETLSIEEDEQGIIQHIKQGLDNAVGISNEALDRVERDRVDATRPETLMGGVDGAEKGLNNVNSIVSTISEDVQNLRNEMAEEREEVDKEVSQILAEIRELASAHQLIRRLQKEDEIGYKIDEEIENFAKALNSKEIYEEAEYEEKEEDKLKNKLQQLLEDESQIVATLQKAENLLNKIDEIDIEEGKEISSEIQEIEQLVDVLETIGETLSDKGITFTKAEETITNIYNLLINIEDQLEKLDNWKKEEDELITKALNQTQKALDKIEG